MTRSSSALSAAGRSRGALVILVVGAVAISSAGILSARSRSRESEPISGGTDPAAARVADTAA
jgi:hypothetical protein